MKPRPLLLTFGNPLLDMTIVVKDTTLHRKFDLPVDGQLEVTEEQKAIFNIAIQRSDVKHSAGGCSLNTSRVFSWVLGEANKVTFVGGIGKDQRAEELKYILTDCGVNTKYIEHPSQPTGSCVALVLGHRRCLCADIGAAAFCGPEDVFNSSILPELEAAPVVYLEGYFITHSFSTALKIAKYCQTNGKLFIFNLCGSYVCEHHPNELSELLPFVDILFGYVEEYHTLQRYINIDDLVSKAKSSANIIHDLKRMFNYCLEEKIFSLVDSNGDLENYIDEGSANNGIHSEDIKDSNESTGKSKKEEEKNISLQLENMSIPQNISPTQNGDHSPPLYSQWKQRKLVVVTQGPLPLIYACGNKVLTRRVAPISEKDIVDTTGAGDSFVGGFLACLIKGRSLTTCLDGGMWAAQHLLKQKGCSIPTYPASFLQRDSV